MKFKLENIVRKNIWNLKPYSSSRDEYKGKEGVFLDANENPFGFLNRYPDPYQTEVKEKLKTLHSIPIENIFIGNGSDEVIDLAIRIFCEPKKDEICIFPPTYGMYQVSANINDVNVNKINLTSEFQLDIENINKEILENSNQKNKLIFVCSPNNPTGNTIDNIEYIVQNFKGIVFVDEAYIDFSKNKSCKNLISTYPNLIVSQTLSKAWASAASRVGICYANKDIISLYNKVKPPYNMSALNQSAAIECLENYDQYNKNVQLILEQKQEVIAELEKLDFVVKIYPSDANFLLVEMKNAENIFNYLIENKIITRNRCSEIANCLRVTIGTETENKILINALRNISKS